jgi:hypothetical protein
VFHRTRATGLENPQDSILSDIATALVPITALLGKPHNVCLTGWLQPVLNKERPLIASPVFKLLLCRCDDTSDASRLGNNEPKPLKKFGLNSVTKNRALIRPDQPNLIKQRTAADMDMVHERHWNKEEQGADADVQPGLLTPQKKTAL